MARRLPGGRDIYAGRENGYYQGKKQQGYSQQLSWLGPTTGEGATGLREGQRLKGGSDGLHEDFSPHPGHSEKQVGDVIIPGKITLAAVWRMCWRGQSY